MLLPDMLVPNAPYAHVPIIGNGPRPAGKPATDLTARAVRVCNRDPMAVKRYLDRHMELASLIYSGAGE